MLTMSRNLVIISVMKEKVTMRDIAKEANVSVATVSYVLNNRNDQAISEATRKKILQIANLYGYKINFAAKSISTGKTNVVALYLGEGHDVFSQAENMLTVEKLTNALHKEEYMLRIAPRCETGRLDYCDAIICCNVAEDFFRTVGEANYCPLIALNSRATDDWLFYQVNTDFAAVKARADAAFGVDNYTVVSLPVYSETLRKNLSDTFTKIVFVQDRDTDVESLLKDANAVVFGKTLGNYCKRFAKNVVAVDLLDERKLATLMQCLDITVNRKTDVEHNIKL